MSTLIANANRIKGGADKIKSLLLAEGQSAGHIEGYADLLAECLVDAPSEQSWQGKRVTAQGAEIDKGIALLSGIKGKAIKVVQLCDISPIVATTTINGVTFTKNNDDSISVVGTATADASLWLAGNGVPFSGIPQGHKFILKANGVEMQSFADGYADSCSNLENNGFNTASSTHTMCRIVVREGETKNLRVYPQIIEVTAMGLENCNTADEVAKALGYASIADVPYIPYTEGEILVSKPSRLISKGRNLWDEEWELGYIDPSTGELSETTSHIRSKNFCHINSGRACLKAISESGATLILYDENYEWVDFWGMTSEGRIVTIADNARYFKLVFVNQDNTYHHDICVNLSDSRNGEYTPYMEDSLAITLPSLFADGILSVGDVADEWGTKATKRVGMVDLGSLNWSKDQVGENWAFFASVPDLAEQDIYQIAKVISAPYHGDTYISIDTTYGNDMAIGADNVHRIWVKDYRYTDTASFKSAMNGVLAYYELATPIEEQTPFPIGFYKAEPNGTEEVQDAESNPTLLDGFIGYEDYDIVANLASAWGIEVGKIGKRVFDGTEADWDMDSSRQNPTFKAYSDVKYLSDLWNKNISATDYKAEVATMNPMEICGFNGSLVYICDSRFTSVDAWKSHLAHLFNIGCPLTIYYEKA